MKIWEEHRKMGFSLLSQLVMKREDSHFTLMVGINRKIFSICELRYSVRKHK